MTPIKSSGLKSFPRTENFKPCMCKVWNNKRLSCTKSLAMVKLSWTGAYAYSTYQKIVLNVYVVLQNMKGDNTLNNMMRKMRNRRQPYYINRRLGRNISGNDQFPHMERIQLEKCFSFPLHSGSEKKIFHTLIRLLETVRVNIGIWQTIFMFSGVALLWLHFGEVFWCWHSFSF